MATAAVYFSGIESEIINCLDEAKGSVIVVVAWFKNEKLFSALSRCLHRGVDIHIAINNDEINFATDGLNFDLLQKHGAKIYLIGGTLKSLVHHKFCVIDNATVISGSYNWTYKANLNHENVIIIKNSEAIAKSYTSEFYDLTKSFEKLTAIKNHYVPAVGSIEALAWWDNLSSDWKCVFADKTNVDRFSVRAKQIDDILCITELTLTDNDITTQGLSASGKIDIKNFEPLYALQKLKKLTIKNNNLQSLSFLNSLSALEILILKSNNITSFNELSACKNLTALSIEDSKKFVFTSLIDMGLLNHLELINIKTIDFDGIEHYKYLNQLSIFDSKIFNFECISYAPSLLLLKFIDNEIDKVNIAVSSMSLKILKLSGRKKFMLKVIDDIFESNVFNNLERVYLNDMPGLKKLDKISKLTNLKTLSISETGVDNINFIQSLVNLEELYLSDTDIRDISPLLKLPLLRLLSIYKMDLDNVLSIPNYFSNIFKNKQDTTSDNTKAELLALKARKPNCMMRHTERGVEY